MPLSEPLPGASLKSAPRLDCSQADMAHYYNEYKRLYKIDPPRRNATGATIIKCLEKGGQPAVMRSSFWHAIWTPKGEKFVLQYPSDANYVNWAKWGSQIKDPRPPKSVPASLPNQQSNNTAHATALATAYPETIEVGGRRKARTRRSKTSRRKTRRS